MGQTASVSVVTNNVTNVLYVPSSAVTTFGGQSFVTVVSGKTQTQTPVQIGVVGDTSTQITSGRDRATSRAVTAHHRGSTTGTGAARAGPAVSAAPAARAPAARAASADGGGYRPADRRRQRCLKPVLDVRDIDARRTATARPPCTRCAASI